MSNDGLLQQQGCGWWLAAGGGVLPQPLGRGDTGSGCMETASIDRELVHVSQCVCLWVFVSALCVSVFFKVREMLSRTFSRWVRNGNVLSFLMVWVGEGGEGWKYHISLMNHRISCVFEPSAICLICQPVKCRYEC